MGEEGSTDLISNSTFTHHSHVPRPPLDCYWEVKGEGSSDHHSSAFVMVHSVKRWVVSGNLKCPIERDEKLREGGQEQFSQNRMDTRLLIDR